MARISRWIIDKFIRFSTSRFYGRWMRDVVAALDFALPISILVELSKAWRIAGIYEKSIQRLFNTIECRRGSARDVFERCRFTRRLGFALGQEDLENLKRVSSGLPDFQQDWIRRVTREFSDDAGAYCLKGDLIAEIVRRSQIDWRDSFIKCIRESVKAGGICVVGNSSSLCGQRLGTSIDSRALVVRFNRCNGAAVEDLGAKLDVWMAAPGYDGPIANPSQFLVLSSVESHWVLRDWSKFRCLIEQGLPILTVPRCVWREAVEAVKAPPSAGFLLLGWLRRILGGWKGVSIAGIATPGPRYHQAGTQYPPARHHNFEAEAKNVERYVRAGLERIG